MTEKQLETIRRWTDLGDLRAAGDLVRALLVEDAQDPVLWELEARLRAGMKELDTAAYAVEQAVLQSPKSVQSLLLQAWFARELRNLDEAKDWENAALDEAETEEDGHAVLLSQARTLLVEAQVEIDEMVEEMAEEDEDVPEVMQIPDELVEIFQDGLEALGDILDDDPEHAEAWALEADFYSLMNQSEKAVESRNRALECMPEKMAWLHAQAEEMERIEEGEKACALYRRLFALEQKALKEAKTPYGLFFEPQEFSAMCAKAWQELEGYIREEGVTLDFSVVCEPMPSEELIEEAIPEEPFDPWTGFHLVIEPRDIGRDLIKITLFQRNVERFWREGGDVSMHEMLLDILDDAAAPAILLADGNELFDQE